MRPSPGPTPVDELPFYGQQLDHTPDERFASRGTVMALLAGLVAVLLLPALSSSGSPTIADPAAFVIEEPVLAASADDPALPRAFVIGAPGPGAAVVPGMAGVSVFYASAAGVPVLVDLDTGNRRQLLVEDEWRWYEFLIESGEIVSGKDAGHSWPVATDRAIAVAAVRTGLSPSGDWEIALCVAGRCEPPPPGEAIISGIDTIRALDRQIDPAIADMFDPEVWPRDGRWIQAPPVSGLDLRLPIPADDAAIWLVEQPG